MVDFSSRGRGLRIAGLAFLALAAFVFAWDAAASLREGAFALRPLGAWWSDIDQGSLNLFQVLVQRYIEPHTVSGIWFDAIQPVLLWPAAIDLAVPGALLFAIGALRGRSAA